MLASWNRSAPKKSRASRRKLRFGEILEKRLVLSAVPPTVVDVELASTEWTPAFYSYLDAEGLGDNGYQVPVGSSAQNTTLPWNNLDVLRVTFSENVFIDQADLSLTSSQQAAFEVLDFDFDPSTNVAEWTFADALPNDRFLIDIDTDGADAVRDWHGNLLDGEWVNGVSTYASGNGTAGGDFEFSFSILAGDAFGIELLEYNNLWSIYLSVGQDVNDPLYLPERDINGNGVIDTPDWEQVWNNLWETLPTGTPIGATDDAPTTSGFDRVAITDYTTDSIVQLDSGFSDHGSNASALTYTIESISDPSLFDSAYINPTTGELIFNAATPPPLGGGFAGISGGNRATVTVSAEDGSGQKTQTSFSVDIIRDNIAPVITNITTTEGIGGTWLIEGYVTDVDDDLDPMYVSYIGSDNDHGLASVAEDGYFIFGTILDPNEVVSYDLLVNDLSGGTDEIFGIWIGV